MDVACGKNLRVSEHITPSLTTKDPSSQRAVRPHNLGTAAFAARYGIPLGELIKFGTNFGRALVAIVEIRCGRHPGWG